LTHMPRPVVVCSRCLEFEHCRYDGQMISSPIVKELRNHADFVTPCPEVQIGLGVPRKRIRVVKTRGDSRLIQPETGKEFTAEMKEYVGEFLDGLGVVDGFILKSASPSCGIKDVKIYPRAENAAAVERGAGFFGGEVLSRFGKLAIEDDARLRNERIREHFLTKLFTLASFRVAREKGGIRDLVAFHTRNKLLLMAYGQAQLQRLGRITANAESEEPAQVMDRYSDGLSVALARGPRIPSVINVLMHALGRFKEKLAHEEKALFLDSLGDYREGKVCMASPAGLLRSWAVRFDDRYLLEQTIFGPYPRELDLRPEKGRDYWS
jgi:uncharacterized protein YbgA (DUF1722 family)/uncharacterized protein YbbK (DUF523 family)